MLYRGLPGLRTGHYFFPLAEECLIFEHCSKDVDQVGDEDVCTLLEDDVQDAIHSHGFVGAELCKVVADLTL